MVVAAALQKVVAALTAYLGMGEVMPVPVEEVVEGAAEGTHLASWAAARNRQGWTSH